MDPFANRCSHRHSRGDWWVNSETSGDYLDSLRNFHTEVKLSREDPLPSALLSAFCFLTFF